MDYMHKYDKVATLKLNSLGCRQQTEVTHIH